MDYASLDRYAWTGGDTPTRQQKTNPHYRAIRRMFFREQVRECGGLDLWACAGTSALDRARIFWNRASLDAWRTCTENTRAALLAIGGRANRSDMVIYPDRHD